MTINLNGVEFYTAQEVEARIREAVAGKDEKVDMANLPIGTLVKVVDNRAGHRHKVGEILPITEVDMVDVLSYRLDNKIGGWVSPRDIEFVSFPQEGVNMEKLPIGTLVKVVGNRAGHWHEDGEILPITEVDEGDLNELYKLDGRISGWVTVKDIEFVSFPEEEDSTSGDEGLTVDEDESEIKAGDIVIATEYELDITEGSEYEIKERDTGLLYFLDDDGDIRHVSTHEEILRKKSAKRGFKRGDVVYVNEEITDSSGDSICPGVITEFLLERWVLSPNGSIVVVGDGDIGKLTLVCRAEDRMDKSKEDD